jgi:membrane-associated protease RseP (regulator of RpoE activity)
MQRAALNSHSPHRDDEPSVRPPISMGGAISERRWIELGRTMFAVVIVGVLLVLGLANVVMYSRWHEVEDGVLWGARPEGLTALEVARGSAGAAAGIDRGDVLLAVNGSPVDTPADVVEYQHQSREATRLAYTLLRVGSRQALEITLTPAPRGSPM